MADAQTVTDLDRALTATEAVVAGIADDQWDSSTAICDEPPPECATIGP